MPRFSFTAALIVLLSSASALAEGGADDARKNWNDAGVAELPATLKVPAKVLVSAGASDGATPVAKKKKKAAKGVPYKALLGEVPLARDIEASPSVAVRVLPTSHALGGDDAAQPILLRPRVDGSGNYGVHFRAKF